MRRIGRIALALILFGSPVLPSHAYTPALLLGLQGGATWFDSPEDGEGALPLAVVSFLVGWRDPTSAGGYLGLAGSARVLSYFGSPMVSADEEGLALEAGLPLGWGLLELEGGLDASVVGDGEEPAHFHPRWRAGLRFGGEAAQGILSYRGSYLLQPGDKEDFLYQGLRLGGEWEHSLRLGLAAGLEAGWELWPEYELLDGSGFPTGVPRHDLVGTLELGLDGLAAYFLDWNLEAAAGLRWSTANRFQSAIGLEEGSENNLFAELRAAADWSPHRATGFRLEGFLRREWYLTRAALTAALADSGETLRVLCLGLTARADWTPNNRLFLVLEGSGARRFANDPAEERWNASLQGGVEYRF